MCVHGCFKCLQFKNLTLAKLGYWFLEFFCEKIAKFSTNCKKAHMILRAWRNQKWNHLWGIDSQYWNKGLQTRRKSSFLSSFLKVSRQKSRNQKFYNLVECFWRKETLWYGKLRELRVECWKTTKNIKFRTGKKGGIPPMKTCWPIDFALKV